MKQSIEIPAQLAGISTLVAGGLSLRFSTQELQPEEEVVIFQHKGEAGYLLFSPNQFSEGDIPQDDTLDSGFKTPSQRLRAVLYKLHIEKGGESDEFSGYYNKQMEKIISHFKLQIDELKA